MPETGPAPAPAPTLPLPTSVGGEIPLTQSAAEATQGAAQASVYDAVSNPTPTAQTFIGGIQSAAQTVPGAIATTTTNTGVSLGIGSWADLPEMLPSMFAAMFLYQGLKHWKKVDQDRFKWFLLPLLAMIAAFVIVYFGTHGDVWEAAAHCVKTCWIAGYQAMLQYGASKPFGIFSSAADAE